MSKHWTEKIFIDEAHIFGHTLKERIKKTEKEIEGLLKIFEKYNVPKKGAILDLACGIGRHSVPLAKKGYNVTGVDFSPTYISNAIEYSDEKNVTKNTHFIEGDMRNVEEILREHIDSFDVVLNLFTSMGYWDEKTDRHIFTQALNLTKPGGIFIIHTANRDYLVKHFQARDVISWEGGRVMLADRRLNLENSRMHNVWKYFDQVEDNLRYLTTSEFDHRIYSLHELKKQIEKSGWQYQECIGGFDMEEFAIDTFNMILIARK
jgi:SAM-dependent methyltransferase